MGKNSSCIKIFRIYLLDYLKLKKDTGINIGPIYKLMHLKDIPKNVAGNLSGSTAVEHDIALGAWQLDKPGILKAGRKARVLHYYIEAESPDYYKQVPQTMAYLKNLTY